MQNAYLNSLKHLFRLLRAIPIKFKLFGAAQNDGVTFMFRQALEKYSSLHENCHHNRHKWIRNGTMDVFPITHLSSKIRSSSVYGTGWLRRASKSNDGSGRNCRFDSAIIVAEVAMLGSESEPWVQFLEPITS